MLRYILAIVLLAACIFPPKQVQAQDQEIQQLLLDLEKLKQFKSILQNLYDGYKVLENGYNKVRDITSGNFNLHEIFLDGLWLVSPQVKKYRRVVDIIEAQAALVSSYKKAFSLFKGANVFSDDEINYIGRVYSGLLDESADNLDELLLVVTDSKLRMSDDERISRIDRIYKQMATKLAFLRDFNGSTQILAMQRAKDDAEIKSLQKIYQPN